ncbi:hypothetical protein ABZY42_20900, partial [Streptomyces sp. NPDC006622]|uniref:hypothetical protein n=1 Tax=Streptomyces sp. NPDC006622 TaxID=3155459 RepID=UPI0033A54FBA
LIRLARGHDLARARVDELLAPARAMASGEELTRSGTPTSTWTLTRSASRPWSTPRNGYRC